ncbi:MAG: ATP-binding cassette domain-containing protein [Planctomycetota bacterium]
MDKPEAVIQVRDLSFRFEDKLILDRISFDVFRREALVIMGESGCGKTTLLKILIGLLNAHSGSVTILGRDLGTMDEDALNDFRVRIGMLFQFGALINSLTVGENVLLALQKRTGIDERLAGFVARTKLAMVGLEEVFDLYPSELSGGMKKRAGLARAMILDPELFFFDEPTSGLDPMTAAGLDELIVELKQVLRTTMVVVTHDLTSAFHVGDRLIMLHDGKILAAGTQDDLRASKNPDVQRFLRRSAPVMDREPDHWLGSLFVEDA